MVDELMRWLSEHEGPGSYLVLAAASALEYVVPPLPGDTIALFGTFLAATAGYNVAVVYGALTGGAVAGSLVAWSFGLYLGSKEEDWPSFLRTPKTIRRIRRVIDRFDAHGGAYLAINRFLPAFRALFFVAAGMAKMPAWKVVLFGGASAAAWNLLILTVGFSVGNNWERLEQLARQYTLTSVAIVAVLATILAARYVIRRRRSRRAD